MDLKSYKTSPDIFDELLTNQKRARPGMGQLANFLKKSSLRELNERKRNAELSITTMGISFTVYSQGDNIDRGFS